MLLNSHISQVNLRTLNLCLVVSTMSKSRKSTPVKIYSQRRVASHQSIKTNIKLFPSNQQGIPNVPLSYIGISRMILPLCNLPQSIEQKNAFSLRFSSGFHNPYIFLLVHTLHFFELVCKDYILIRQNECLRIKIITMF